MMSPVTFDSSSSSSGGQLAFLHRIADDDHFRAEVEADPRGKLAEFGLHVEPQDLPSHVTLPEKEVLQKGTVLADSLPFGSRWFGFLG